MSKEQNSALGNHVVRCQILTMALTRRLKPWLVYQTVIENSTKVLATALPKCLLDKWKKKMQFNIYRYSPVWQLFQCQLSLHPGRITCFLFTLLFYLAISLGLAASPNNLSLDYLHATCFYTSIQKTHNNSSVKYISHKYHCVLYFYTIVLLTIITLQKLMPLKVLCTSSSLSKKITTEIKTTRLLTISVIYKKKNPQLYLTLYLSSQLLLNYS